MKTQPSGIDFRAGMRCYPSGVAIVTAQFEGEQHGATVTSVTSVALDPPTLLVCLSRESRTRGAVLGSRRFVVNVLAGGHKPLAEAFSTRSNGSRFALNGRWAWSGDWGACLEDPAALFRCEVAAVHEVGSHSVFIGTAHGIPQMMPQVEGVLVYLNGAYHVLPLHK